MKKSKQTKFSGRLQKGVRSARAREHISEWMKSLWSLIASRRYIRMQKWKVCKWTWKRPNEETENEINFVIACKSNAFRM